MESGAISDSQISSSSEFFNHVAIQGRLNFQETSVKAGAWVAASRNVNQWLQVDLGIQLTNVIRVATQGRHYSCQWVALHSQWVTKYKLQYSDDGVNFQYYREQGKTKDKVKIFCLRNVLTDKLECTNDIDTVTEEAHAQCERWHHHTLFAMP